MWNSYSYLQGRILFEFRISKFDSIASNGLKIFPVSTKLSMKRDMYFIVA